MLAGILDFRSARMSLDSLLLSRLAPWRGSSAWWVAFSGGLDSTVLAV